MMVPVVLWMVDPLLRVGMPIEDYLLHEHELAKWHSVERIPRPKPLITQSCIVTYC